LKALDGTSAAFPPSLHRRTFHRAERAEYAAIAEIWPKQRLAIAAFIKELASVRSHAFLIKNRNPGMSGRIREQGRTSIRN